MGRLPDRGVDPVALDDLEVDVQPGDPDAVRANASTRRRGWRSRAVAEGLADADAGVGAAVAAASARPPAVGRRNRDEGQVREGGRGCPGRHPASGSATPCRGPHTPRSSRRPRARRRRRPRRGSRHAANRASRDAAAGLSSRRGPGRLTASRTCSRSPSQLLFAASRRSVSEPPTAKARARTRTADEGASALRDLRRERVRPRQAAARLAHDARRAHVARRAGLAHGRGGADLPVAADGPQRHRRRGHALRVGDGRASC